MGSYTGTNMKRVWIVSARRMLPEQQVIHCNMCQLLVDCYDKIKSARCRLCTVARPTNNRLRRFCLKTAGKLVIFHYTWHYRAVLCWTNDFIFCLTLSKNEPLLIVYQNYNTGGKFQICWVQKKRIIRWKLKSIPHGPNTCPPTYQNNVCTYFCRDWRCDFSADNKNKSGLVKSYNEQHVLQFCVL